MLIRLGFDIQFEIPAPVADGRAIPCASIRGARTCENRMNRSITPTVPIDEYEDSFGNVCTRFVAPAGKLQLYHSTLIEDSGEPDPVSPDARQVPVEDLPPEVLRYLLASRYCEVDRLWTMRELYSATRNQDGRASRRSVTGCRRMSHSATTLPVRQRRRWMFTRIARASAAIFSIWPSRFAVV